jgi:carbonic anhydrase/acetyltransferase-like protein (isoleucine patch superfamily)
VVMAGTRVPAGSMVAGVPATVKGTVDEARDAMMWLGHRFYQSLPPRYRESCSEVSLEEARRLYGEAEETG